MTDSLLQWTVRIDRRQANRDDVIALLNQLAKSVQQLQVEITADDEFWNTADIGAFRDFVSVAVISHPAEAGLEYVAEELLEEFGWLVDFQR